ncbi:MAG: CinA family nicotinamide mononucleotide deamidase-related protein [Dehalococcoidia bacterium]
MKAEIIPVGTEILLGSIVDTNSSFLAGQFPLLGVDLHFISTVGDNQKRLVETLERAWNRADLIITTGGLGPTQDDITREAIAELVGEELTVDQGLWQELQTLFTTYRGKVPQSNMKQASIIPSARILSNRVGTAPGWWVEKDEHIIVGLPGPPDEMKLMWQEGVLPRLQERATGTVIVSRTLKTFGLPESQVDELTSHLSGLSNPSLATYFKPDGIYLRITAKATEKAQVQGLISHSEEQINKVLSRHIWGTDDDTLDSVIGELLTARNLTLATMESCTGGLLCSTLASGRDSHIFFKGGMLACRDEAQKAYGVDISTMEQDSADEDGVARAMARMARRCLVTDIGLGVGGVLGADRHYGHAFVGVSSDRFERTFAHPVRGNHSRMKQRAAYAALFDLRSILLQEVQCT